jgi:hypothetical protein
MHVDAQKSMDRLLDALMPVPPQRFARPPASAHPVSKKRVKLSQYKPRNQRESTALKNLKTRSGHYKDHGALRGLVQCHLALIRDVYPQPKRLKAIRTVQELRRKANLCRNLASRIELPEPIGLELVSMTLNPGPAIREVLLYAQRLESEANTLAARAKHRTLRHSAHIENRAILKVLGAVREITGEPHYEDMATLLRGACREHGITGRRLASLWRNHHVKGRRRNMLSWLA